MGEINSIQVVCACGRKLKAPAKAVGRKARCPACGAVVVVRAAEPVRPTSDARIPRSKTAPVMVVARGESDFAAGENTGVDEYGGDDLDGLAELARHVESNATVIERPRCLQCASVMKEGDVLCTQCGYDTRSGKQLSTSTVKAKRSTAKAGNKKGKKPIDRMAPDGSFIAGVAFSAAFAIGASALWIAVAYATGFTVGYIAILIGGAAGVGMQIGHKGYSSVGGATAAAMTLVAILLAKLIVIELVLSRHNIHKSVMDLDSAKLAYYFFSPIGLIIIAVGMAAAYRTANGSVTG